MGISNAQHKINVEFTDFLRKNLGTNCYTFGKPESDKKVIPYELSHGYLLNNFIIDDSILKYYCLPTINFLTENEFQEMVKSGFAGKKEIALYPYSTLIFGAYYSRTDLYTKLLGIKIGERHKKINRKNVKYLSDLIPYFEDYAKGFEDGFNEFDNKQIKPYLIEPIEKSDRINKVFEFITKHLIFSHSWAGGSSGFTTNQDEEIINAFEDGQKQGYFYRAWSFVFSNNNLFAPFFQRHLKTKTIQSSKIEIENEINNLITSDKFCLRIDIIEYPKDNYELFKSNNSDKEDREDKRTRRIENKLKPQIEHFVDFQHKTGLSGTEKKKREGTPDLAFIKTDKTKLTIGEALNFSGINSKNLNKEYNLPS